MPTTAPKVKDHPELDRFVGGYVECIFFTDAGPDSDLPEGVCSSHFAPVTVTKIRKDCSDFIHANLGLLQDAWNRDGYSVERSGHDFWFTRNGHGVGFWDRTELDAGALGDNLSTACKLFPEIHLIQGDDGHLYLE
jgi:hypothetical protein